MVPDTGQERFLTKKGIIMYVNPNFPTKKALKEAIKNGERVVVFAPGIGAPREGEESVEGPHYPKPHSWYARVETKRDGNDIIVTKVKS